MIKIKDNFDNILKWLSILTIAFGLVILLIFVARLTIYGYGFYGELNDQGLEISSKVGDFIGGVVGPFWALASVMLFYYALRTQGKDIAAQIKELKETKEVFQNQQFESNFYNLMRSQQEIANSLSVRIEKFGSVEDLYFEGREFFSIARLNLDEIYKIVTSKLGARLILEDVAKRYGISEAVISSIQKETDEEVIVKRVYKLFFDKYHYVVGHYFRHLYHILKYVDDSYIKELSRDISIDRLKEIENNYFRYASFVQAQMSSDELYLLFYNGVCFPKMKGFIEKYDLLENLAYEDLMSEDHRRLYKRELKSRMNIPV